MPGSIVATDLDGTLTRAETWRGLLAWLRVHRPSGAVRRFAWVRLPLVIAYRLGLYQKEAFRARWVRDLAGLLRGLDEADLAVAGEWVVEHHLWPARRTAVLDRVAGALTEARLADPGAQLVLTTATYQPVADAFARRIGADLALATPLELHQGIATGRVGSAVASGEQKAAGLRAHAAGALIVAAFGDTAEDIPFLRLAARAVAVSPDAGLRAAAAERGWEIVDDEGGSTT